MTIYWLAWKLRLKYINLLGQPINPTKQYLPGRPGNPDSPGSPG